MVIRERGGCAYRKTAGGALTDRGDCQWAPTIQGGAGHGNRSAIPFAYPPRCGGLHAVVRQGLILSIAINSARHGLLALLIGSNFYEVK